MPGIVDDLIARHHQLEAERIPWLDHWYEVARYALPDAERFDGLYQGREQRAQVVDSIVSAPIAAQRSREVYDQTSLWAIDRLVAGMMSLVTPQAEIWHDIASDDAFSVEPSDEEERFYDTVRDFLFRSRDNPSSGFWTAHKAAMRAMSAFGTGVMFTEERTVGTNAPIGYRYVPLSECYLGVDYYGVVDTNFRLFRRSARACVERWGDKVSAKTKRMAENPKDMDKTVWILHAVMPRPEAGSRGRNGAQADSLKTSDVASYYVEIQERHLIGDSGFYTFPFHVYHWTRNNPGPYAEGPLALALADVKSLNMLSKTALTAAQQMIKPPMALAHDGMNRLNLNPGAMNVGYIDSQGRELAKPLITAQRPDFAETILETKRQQIRETLYVNLWQILINSPDMTATEAMIRANEKGDLLGPVGNSIQVTMARMVDRELDLLARQGAFSEGSPLAAPEAAQGRDIGARFTSPLDRLRRGNHAVAIERLFTTAGAIAQSTGNMDILDKLDGDAAIDELQDIYGAPRKVMKTDDQVQAARQARQQQAAAMQAAQAAQMAGDAAQSAAAGAEAVANSPAAQRLAGAFGA